MIVLITGKNFENLSGNKMKIETESMVVEFLFVQNYSPFLMKMRTHVRRKAHWSDQNRLLCPKNAHAGGSGRHHVVLCQLREHGSAADTLRYKNTKTKK